MCEGQILIGLQDEEIPLNEIKNGHTDWQTNKIGGSPDWMPHLNLTSNPMCKVCMKESLLVLQIYCPLGKFSQHRTLYIFCCIQPTCWNKTHGWQVLRSQWQDSSSNTCSVTPVPSSNDTWLDEEDDWGDSGTPVLNDISCSNGQTNNGSEIELQSKIFYEHNVEAACSGMDNLSVSLPVSSFTNSQNDMLSDTMEEFKIEASVIPEDITSSLNLPELELKKKKHFPPKHKNLAFTPYYINVIEEPDDDLQNDVTHAKYLLMDYEMQVGNTYLSMHKNENDQQQCQERYEKPDVKHGDKIFHKFAVRVSRCPQQIVRYQWQGYPLYMNTPEHITPSCQYCGSPRIFEMQLMPFLFSCLHLKEVRTEDIPLDFGTVVISTCLKSCWQEGEQIKEESVYVQSDPDNALYERLSQRYSGVA